MLWSTETVRIVTCQPYFGEGLRGGGRDTQHDGGNTVLPRDKLFSAQSESPAWYVFCASIALPSSLICNLELFALRRRSIFSFNSHVCRSRQPWGECFVQWQIKTQSRAVAANCKCKLTDLYKWKSWAVSFVFAFPMPRRKGQSVAWKRVWYTTTHILLDRCNAIRLNLVKINRPRHKENLLLTLVPPSLVINSYANSHGEQLAGHCRSTRKGGGS